MTRTFLLGAGAALALTACSAPTATAPAPEAPAPAVLPTEAEGAALFDKLGAAIAANDPVKLAAMYTPGAVMLSTSTNDVIKTQEGVLKDATEFTSLKSTPVVNAREVQVLDADTIVTTGVITFDFKKSNRSTWIVGRVTDVWEKQADGSWLVVNEHFAAAPKPVAARLAALAGAVTADQADAPPLGGSAPAPTTAPDPAKK